MGWWALALVQAAAVGFLCFAPALAGLMLQANGHGGLAMGGMTGLAVTLGLMLGWSAVGGVALGALAACVVSGMPLLPAFLLSAVYACEALWGRFLLHRVGHISHDLDRVPHVIRYIVFGGIAVPAFGAIAGCIVVASCLPQMAMGEHSQHLSEWWLGGMVSMLVLGPVVLTWWPRREVIDSRQVLHVLLPPILFVLGALILLLLGLDRELAPGLFVLFPLMIWTAFHHGQRGASLLVLVAFVSGLHSIAHRIGPFESADHMAGYERLLIFSGILSISSLILTAAALERRRLEQRNQVFLELSRRLAVTSSPREAAHIVVQAARDLIGWHACYVAVLSDDSQRINELVKFDTIDGTITELPEKYDKPEPLSPMIRRVINEGAVLLLLDDPRQDSDRMQLNYFDGTTRPSAALMFAPLRHRGERDVGVISVQSYTPNAYSRQDLRLLEALADFCSEALDRAVAERKLRENEERLNRALIGTDLGVWDWNISEDTVVYSEIWANQLEFSLEEVNCGDRIWERLVHPDDLPRVREALRKLLQGSTHLYEIEYRMQTASGKWKWILSCARGVERDENGRAVRVIGTHKDIDAMKRVEIERRAFSKMAERLAATSDRESMFRIIAEETDELFGWDAHYLALSKPGGVGAQLAYFYDTVDGQKKLFPPVRDFRVDVREPRLINRAPEEPLPTNNTTMPFGDTSRLSCSLMHVPVRSGVGISGVISVQSYTPFRYHENDLAVLERLGGLLAPALERAHTAAELQKSEERNRAILDCIPDLMFLLRNDGVFLNYFASNEGSLFLSPQDFLGRSLAEVMPPDIGRQLMKAIRDAVELGHVQTVEYALPLADRIAYFEARIVSASENEVLTIVRDITQRVAAEEALRENDELLRALSDQMPDALFMLDLESPECPLGILFVNRAAGRIYGYAVAELQGRSFESLAPAALHLREQLTTGTARSGVLVLEGTHIRRDGSQFPMELTAREVMHSGRRVMLALVRDITERKRGEEERQRLDARIQHLQKLESLEVLAGGVAHDFNNLLTGILGNTELAMLDLDEQHPVQRHLRNIETTTLRASDLTRQMLAYSGKGKLQVGRLDLSRLVSEMTSILKVNLAKGATLDLDFQQGLPPIKGDPTQIRQIVMNLITNASDALEGNSGVIRVRTGACFADRSYLSELWLHGDLPEGCYVWVEVADNGCGMDAATRLRIFDPFFTTKFTGRGLGLAAVLGIVRGHRGALKVQSEKGRGTTFRVLFPADGDFAFSEGIEYRNPTPSVGILETPPEPLPASNATESVAPSVPLTPAHPHPIELESGVSPAASAECDAVLVVDDEESVREVVKLVVERLGHRVMTATNGHEAIEVMHEHAPEVCLVLMDITMPNLSGDQAMLRIHERWPWVPVVLMSGFTHSEVVEGLRERGDVPFLAKPFRADHLQSLLGRFL